jgi:hypothetical protein
MKYDNQNDLQILQFAQNKAEIIVKHEKEAFNLAHNLNMRLE